MKLKLPDGSWDVEVFLDRSRPGYDDNVFVRIREECPAQWKVFKGSGVTIGITAADARQLARRLAEVAAEDEAAAKAEARTWGSPPQPAPQRKPRAKSPLLFTPTQGKYLAFIHRYQTKYGCSPAESDVQRHMLVSGPSVHQMLVMLERKGLIVRTPGQARSIRLLVHPELIPPLP
ncbi:MAG: MarR family winged helix-turn-helix transcriptional regulator [Verrucomicrobiota bacterium]